VRDAADSVPISNVLNILKEQPSSNSELVNVAAEISDRNQRYSCWYDANDNCEHDPHELTMIDHLLLSKGTTLSKQVVVQFSINNSLCFH
jgi:hypothetical protein